MLHTVELSLCEIINQASCFLLKWSHLRETNGFDNFLKNAKKYFSNFITIDFEYTEQVSVNL